jgi:hypothetical protein
MINVALDAPLDLLLGQHSILLDLFGGPVIRIGEDVGAEGLSLLRLAPITDESAEDAASVFQFTAM